MGHSVSSDQLSVISFQRQNKLKKFFKFVDTQTCLTNNSSQCATVEFFVIWNNDLSKRLISAQNHVTAFLALQVKADFAEGFRAFPPRNTR
ncbi:MAG: hypothetical protein AUJ21_04355 [Anaerolineae bacterium CG1_02_58_13]|nr:MAG: hypothetical protein AUJ21_04355 [Anaerolineae bacterium CG1_02_58_13]